MHLNHKDCAYTQVFIKYSTLFPTYQCLLHFHYNPLCFICLINALQNNIHKYDRQDKSFWIILLIVSSIYNVFYRCQKMRKFSYLFNVTSTTSNVSQMTLDM